MSLIHTLISWVKKFPIKDFLLCYALLVSLMSCGGGGGAGPEGPQGPAGASGSTGSANVATTAADYTLSSTDYAIFADASAAAFNLTLPDATTNSGKLYILKKIDATVNAVTVLTTAAQTIDGSATTTLNTTNETLHLVSDGTNWQITQRRTITAFTSYIMNITADTTDPTKGVTAIDLAVWRRVGDSMQIHYEYGQTAAGTAGVGLYLFNIPTGYAIDPAKTFVGSADGQGKVGYVAVHVAGGIYSGDVLIYDATHFSLKLQDPTAGSGTQFDAGSGTTALNNVNVNFTFTATIPILNWNN